MEFQGKRLLLLFKAATQAAYGLLGDVRQFHQFSLKCDLVLGAPRRGLQCIRAQADHGPYDDDRIAEGDSIISSRPNRSRRIS